MNLCHSIAKFHLSSISVFYTALQFLHSMHYNCYSTYAESSVQFSKLAMFFNISVSILV